MGSKRSEQSPVLAPKKRQKTQPPRMFRVLLHNDDYTSMEFVIEVLRDVFRKPMQEATAIMLNVHHKGVGQCGVYPSQTAETKVTAVHQKARENGFPLQCSMEPE